MQNHLIILFNRLDYGKTAIFPVIDLFVFSLYGKLIWMRVYEEIKIF